MSKFLRTAIVAFAFFGSISGCASQGKPAAEPPNASFEFKGVKFKSGEPAPGGSLNESLQPPNSEQFRALQYDADVLKRVPVFRMEVVGFADNRECTDQACYDLSMRRAVLVHDWLVDHGVLPRCLGAPRGLGSEIFIDDNQTEDGRQQNRRAEVVVVDFDCK